MLNRDKLIQSFNEIIGWPYVSPGTNDRNGIDCSGAFVRAYQAQGASIYHGSNRIIRRYCSDAFRVTSENELEPGMAVWKWRNDGKEPAEYKPGGGYYDPDLLGNYYHIGLVVSINPLRIVHASTPVAKVDTSLKGVSGTPWSWAAHLSAVDYSGQYEPVPEPVGIWGTVTTANGSLRMWTQPGGQDNSAAEYMLTIPKGTRIKILAEALNNGVLWYQTEQANRNGTHTGWVISTLVTLDDDPEPPEVQPRPGEPETPTDDSDWLQVRNMAAKIQRIANLQLEVNG